jgi:Mrp family chromosome partitioning ATPase
MSLMLDALRRIEAKQTPLRARDAAPPLEPFASPSTAGPAEPLEFPPELPVAATSMPQEDFALPEPLALDAAMDQLQALVSEAALLYNAELEFDAAAEVQEAEWPAAAPSPIEFAVVEQAATPVDEEPASAAPPPFIQDVELDGPGVECPEVTSLPEAVAPLVAPLAADPYAETAQQILRQLPRSRSQVLLFTSPADGQGKTMTLARLAPRLAQAVEGNVLVVDANSRNPDMARWLDVAPAWCLPDVLDGAADWSAAVQTTAHQGVSLLPGGTGIQGRGSGRNAPGAGRLLRDLAGHYDLVVVDAPSLAHRGTVQLAAVCDAAYLVVRLGDGSPRMLREAAQVLHCNGGRLLGCVAIDSE